MKEFHGRPGRILDFECNKRSLCYIQKIDNIKIIKALKDIEKLEFIVYL